MRSEFQNENYDNYSTELLAQKAESFFQEGLYVDSANLYEQVLDMIRCDPSCEKPGEVLRYSNMCGMALRRGGCLIRAIPHYNKAIEISNREVNYLNNLAIVYMEMGSFSESTALFHEVLKSSEGHSADSFYKTNYATLLIHSGEYSTAAKLLKESLLYYRQHPSSSVNDQAHAYFRLGCLLAKLGHYEAALAVLKEARQSKSSIWGNGHQRVVEITRAIAETYLDFGHLAQAYKYAQESLDFYKNKIDEEAPEKGRALQIIGSVLCQRKQEGANEYFEQAEIIFKAAYRDCENHPDIARSESFWGEYYGRKGEYHKAIEHFRNAEAIYERCYQQSKITYQAEIYNNLGYCLHKIGEDRTAWRYYRKSRRLFYCINRHHAWLNLLFRNMKDVLCKKGHNRLAQHIPEHVTSGKDLLQMPKQIRTEVKTARPEIHVVLTATPDKEQLLQELIRRLSNMKEYFVREYPRVSFSVQGNDTKAFEQTNEEQYYKVIFVALHGNKLGAPRCTYRTIRNQPWIVDYRDRSLFELITILNLHRCDLAVVYSFEKNVRSVSALYRKDWKKFPNKPVYFKSCCGTDSLEQVVNDVNRHVLMYMERFNEEKCNQNETKKGA